MLPRTWPGRSQLGWRDKIFGSLSKKDREIESDTWQGPLPGRLAGEPGGHPSQAFPGQHLARVLTESRSGHAGGRGWVCGSRQPVGNGKARTLVMAGLQYSCVDVNRRGGICDLLPKMLVFPVAASERVLGPLLESSRHHCSTLAASKTPKPPCLRYLHQPRHPTPGSSLQDRSLRSTGTQRAPFYLTSVILRRPSAGPCLPTFMASGAQGCSESTQWNLCSPA